ncbi:DinB family protein [Georgenia sp. TF02-10]|uniref:DinB family protein n=1 Tax=Georgenia sp. TF02-10 TaxID=2917725 RepID=UPI001FA6F84F|nr:DinB family protein [Georgenia sp. TF02-10]UNX54582.1 DinB family protein [Georgenia sp. TF02-10]
MTDAKDMLHGYLQSSRDAMLWKLEGLSERDLRWPRTPTGTNLLGLVKHLAGVELGYFGDTFGRPSPVALPWLADDAEANADMWATAEESVEYVTDLYRRAWAHADATIAALDLDAPGRVPWWRQGDVTLHRVLVHVIADTARHAGHADILREQLDGAVGLRVGVSNLPDVDRQWWEDYVARLRRVAEGAAG